MQCQNCGLPLDPQQVAQTGRCPRCGVPVALASQGYQPQQPAFQSGPPVGAGADDESPTIRVRPQAPAPAPPPAPSLGPVDPFAATQRSPQPPPPTPSPYGPPPGAAASPYGAPPGSGSGPAAQPPAYNPPPGATDPFAPAAGGFAPPPPPQQPIGAPPPSYSGPGQPSYGGPPQPAFGAPAPGGFGGPGQPPTYGSAPTFGGPGQPPPYGAPAGFSGPPPTPGFPGGPMAPAPKKSRAGLIIGILIAVLIIGTIGSLAALGFAGKGPLKSLGPTPTPAATNTPTATATPLPTPTSSVPAGFQKFTSDDNTFSIAYPGNWQQSAASSGSGAQFTSSTGQVFFVFDIANPGSSTADELDSAFCQGTNGSGGFGGAPSAPTSITIGGQSWTQEECDNSDGTLHAVAESIIYKDKAFFIAYASSKLTFAQDQGQYYQPMEQSFQFLV